MPTWWTWRQPRRALRQNFARMRPPMRVVSLAMYAFLSGCESSRTPEAEFTHDHLAPRPVALAKFLEDTLIGTPWRLHVLSDSILLVTDNQAPHLHAVHRQRRAVLRSFGRAGRGPGEFVSVPEIARFRAAADSFVTWARDLSRYTISSAHPPRGNADSTIALTRHGATLSPILIGDTLLLLQSATDSTEFAAYALRDSTATFFGRPMRFAKSDSLTPLAAITLPGEVVACASPDGRMLVRASRVAGRAQLVQVGSAEEREVDVPYAFEPFYEWDPEYSGYVVQQVARQRRAYIDCAATREGFFLLFSGRLRGAFTNQYDRLLGQFVHAFGWDGKLRYVAKFDSPVWAIAVAENGRDLYAVRWEPTPALVTGELPALTP